MKYNVTIEEISKEELVDLFSTSMTGSFWLQIDMPDKEHFKRIAQMSDEEYDNLTIEDIMAIWVLKGQMLRFEDMSAESKDELNGNKGKWDKDNDCAYYMIGLEDIKEGLAKAATGDKYERECFVNFADGERINMDFPQADILMQIILFGEYVYG